MPALSQEIRPNQLEITPIPPLEPHRASLPPARRHDNVKDYPRDEESCKEFMDSQPAQDGSLQVAWNEESDS